MTDEAIDTEDQIPLESAPEEQSRIARLPLSRVKNLMKLDNDLILPLDSVFVVTAATELFIESLIKQSYNEIISTKKKTIQKRDVEKVIESTDSLLFLENATDIFNANKS